MTVTYKILADADTAVVIPSTPQYSPVTFYAIDGLSAYDRAERYSATEMRKHAFEALYLLVIKLNQTNAYSQYIDPIHEATHALMAARDEELAVYARTEPGGAT